MLALLRDSDLRRHSNSETSSPPFVCRTHQVWTTPLQIQVLETHPAMTSDSNACWHHRRHLMLFCILRCIISIRRCLLRLAITLNCPNLPSDIHNIHICALLTLQQVLATHHCGWYWSWPTTLTLCGCITLLSTHPWLRTFSS